MKEIRRTWILLVLAGLFLSPLLTVYGSVNPRITISEPPSSDKSKMKDLCSQVNETLDFKFLEYDPSDDNVTIEIAMSDYKKLSQKAKQRVMQTTLGLVQSSGVSRANRNKIYNFIADEDVLRYPVW